METPLTIPIFLGVTLALFGIWLAIFHSWFSRIMNRLDRIAEALLPVSQISSWVQQKGLERFFKGFGNDNPAHKSWGNPLSLQEQRRRDELLQKGSAEGLTPWEAEELQALLRKEAQDDFAKGMLTFIAFLGVLALIKALVDSLERKKYEQAR